MKLITLPRQLPEGYGLKITLTNETKGHTFSKFIDEDSHEYHKTSGSLFRSLQEEWGRCRSKVYRDLPDGSAKQVGWFFESRQEYEDSRDTYLRGAWVEVLAPRKSEA